MIENAVLLRIPMLVFALTLLAAAFAHAAAAQSTQLGWESVEAAPGGSNRNGFEDVEVQVRAMVDVCPTGDVYLRLQVDPNSVRVRSNAVGMGYWMGGERYTVPAGVSMPRPTGLYVSGTIRAGTQSARFRVTATGDGGRGGCLTSTGDPVSIQMRGKDANAFRSSISVDFEQCETITSSAVQSALYQQKREAAQQAEAEKRKAEQERRQAVEKAEADRAKAATAANAASGRQMLQVSRDGPSSTSPKGTGTGSAGSPKSSGTSASGASGNSGHGGATGTIQGALQSTGTGQGYRPASTTKTTTPVKKTTRSARSSSSGYSSGESSGSSSSSSSGSGGTTAMAGAGAAGVAGLAGAAKSGSSSSASSSSYKRSKTEIDEDFRDDGGPKVLGPVMGTLGATALTTGLYVAFASGMNAAISDRVDELASAKVAQYAPVCTAGDATACTEQVRWEAFGDEKRRGNLSWDADTLLGPGFAYSFGVGYARSHRRGQLAPGLAVGRDDVMTGVAVEVALRMRLLRFELGYGHMRGDLVDPSSNVDVTAQGVDSFMMGAAIQPGWHQLPSPYLGIQYRIESTSGDVRFTTPKSRTKFESFSGFEGRRLLGTAGVTVNLPVKHDGVMFKTASLNFGYFQALDDGPLESGWTITFGGTTWLPASISALEGMTALTPDRPNQRNTIVTPYAMWGGLGLQVFNFEKDLINFNAVDLWLAPGSSGWERAGFALCGFGPVWRQPGGVHGVALRLTPLALQRDTRSGPWTRPLGDAPLQDGPVAVTAPSADMRPRYGDLQVWGVGAATLAWRAQLSNHTLEAGLKMPLAWWSNRTDNTIGGERPSWFDGPPPMFAFLGYGY